MLWHVCHYHVPCEQTAIQKLIVKGRLDYHQLISRQSIKLSRQFEVWQTIDLISNNCLCKCKLYFCIL